MTPEETGRLFRELGVISGQISAQTATLQGHEQLDEERHRNLLNGQQGITNRLDALERETAEKLDEDDLQVITGKHDLASALAKSAELEQRLKDGYRESQIETEKRLEAAKDVERKLEAERKKKLEGRKKLIERILLMLIAGLLTLATEQAGKHLGGEDATKKKSTELKLEE